MRGAKRRSNPDGEGPSLDRFARNDGQNCRHCEEQRRSNPDGEGPSKLNAKR
ncbi:MAG: hypothetical protein LBT00_13255 [Spirochaetaceae bacterium]|nr:hypothetical protein [Spirochaetaceae bacterium]